MRDLGPEPKVDEDLANDPRSLLGAISYPRIHHQPTPEPKSKKARDEEPNEKEESRRLVIIIVIITTTNTSTRFFLINVKRYAEPRLICLSSSSKRAIKSSNRGGGWSKIIGAIFA